MAAAAALLLAAALAAGAQPPVAHGARIGVLMFAPLTTGAQDEFRQGFREAGYVEGRNVAFEWRSAQGDVRRADALAKELVALKVDVIVAEFTPSVRAAQKATKTIPIVMASAGDPVATGFVPSLAHPGGNITGFTNLASELSAKRFELLQEILPRLRRVGLLLNGSDPLDAAFISETRSAARQAGMQLYVAKVPRAQDLDPALAALVREKVGATILLANIPVPTAQVARLVARYRLPAISLLKEFPEAGGLVSYGASVSDIRERVAGYVARILRGAKPGDLPVEQPTKIELILNLNTARALGIAIPPSIVARADRVIE